MNQRIIHADCLDAISNNSLKPAEFDVQISDPPYSEHVHKNATSQSVGGGTRHRDLGFASLSDHLRNGIAICVAEVKKWSLIYSDVEGLSAWKTACESRDATYIRAIPWVRWSSPQLSGDRPPQGCEMVSLFWGSQPGRKSWNGPGNLTHLAHTCLRGEGKHKAEKPLDQMLDLVSWFTNPGDRVLDLCAGSGTVGLACAILGRSYVGYEIDETWAKSGQARIDLYANEIDMSERDSTRYMRWLASRKEFEEAKAKRDSNTAKQRAKLEAKRVVQ